MMDTIKVFGTTPPCAKCKRAEREALKAAEKFPGQVEVQKLDALGLEADAYGMMVTPTVVVNDEVVGSGRIVPADRLVGHIRSPLGG
jgi:thiol-disulfide isomerase/thioredoxin